jgi:twitching motility protein PilT
MALFDFRRSNASAAQPGPTRPVVPSLPAQQGLVPMEDLLRLAVEQNASDVHISVGAPPTLRISGKLVKLETAPLTPEDTETLARSVASEGHLQRVNEEGGVDFGFSFREQNRFRVSVYRQKGHIGIVLRLIPRQMRTLEEIGLPASVKPLLNLPRGLILVTGPTGSGKTTTLASMLDVINATSDSHIITIEDPIEYFHVHMHGIVNQREVGVDVPSFSEGLRRALRQDPDVILVGEMRDLETMETAVTAAETGHLVFSTLHTTGASRTVDRIIDAFPSTQQAQIRVQLSTNLKAVVSQVLLPRCDGPGRVAAFEVMINTPSIAALIRDNKTFRIASDIQTGAKYGMVSLEASLVELYLDGKISQEQVLTKAQDPDQALQLIGTQKPRKSR